MTQERYDQFPAAPSAQLTDIVLVAQGYISPSSLGNSVQETWQQVFNLFKTNLAYIPTSAWFPTFTFATPGDLSVVYAIHAGQYSQIGNVVTVSFVLVCTPTYTTASGTAIVGGLPFASNPGSGNNTYGSCFTEFVTYPPSCTNFILFLQTGQQTIQICGQGSNLGFTTLTTTQVISGAQINIQGTMSYLV